MVTSIEEEEELKEGMNFSLLSPSTTRMAPRLARLALKGRNAINTPHYVAITSRGVVPHLSQDMVKKHTNLGGAYVALEDCKLLNSFTRNRTLFVLILRLTLKF